MGISARREREFADFVAAEGAGLLRYAYVLTQDAARAEDLLQQALLNTYARWGRQDIDAPAAYVRRAIVNGHVSWWRRWGNREVLGAAVPPTAHRDHDDVERVDEVRCLLRSLPARQRTVLFLRYYEGATDATIAQTLGCAEGTVRSLASRAISRLRVVMDAAETTLSSSEVRAWHATSK